MLHTPLYPWGKPVRQQRPNRFQKYGKALPIQPHAATVFNRDEPFSIFTFLYQLAYEFLFPPSSHPKKLYQGYYDPATQSVHVTDETTVRALWEQGFFGKGSLSRSEPEWIEGEKRRLGLLGPSQSQTSAAVTKKRREDRREVKLERARLEAEAVKEQLRSERDGTAGKPSMSQDENTDDSKSTAALQQQGSDTLDAGDAQPVESSAPATGSESLLGPGHGTGKVTITNQEHLQLSAVEAFFLSYSLGVLNVVNLEKNEQMSITELFTLFCRVSRVPQTPNYEPDDAFLVSYVVYHHFRSLGWVVRPGMKFAVDYLLYHRGPVFSHAEFAVVVLPSYSDGYWSATEERKKKCEQSRRREWWWLLGANRVQTQVRKTLVLVYVDIPPPYADAARNDDDDGGIIDITAVLQRYRVREFVVKRWSPNRNRD